MGFLFNIFDEERWNYGYSSTLGKKYGEDFNTKRFRDIKTNLSLEKIRELISTIKEKYSDIVIISGEKSFYSTLEIYEFLLKEISDAIKEKTNLSIEEHIANVKERYFLKARRLMSNGVIVEFDSPQLFVTKSGAPMIPEKDYEYCKPTKIEELCFIITGTYINFEGTERHYKLSNTLI